MCGHAFVHCAEALKGCEGSMSAQASTVRVSFSVDDTVIVWVYDAELVVALCEF